MVAHAATAGPIRAAGANPASAYERHVVTPLTNTTALTEVLLAATPLIFTGLAFAVAFRAGYFNIGRPVGRSSRRRSSARARSTSPTGVGGCASRW